MLVLQATHAALGTLVAAVSVLKEVKTYDALWWVGATAGSRTISTKVPTRCQTAEKPLMWAMDLVGRQLRQACSTRTTATPAQHLGDEHKPRQPLSHKKIITCNITCTTCITWTVTCREDTGVHALV